MKWQPLLCKIGIHAIMWEDELHLAQRTDDCWPVMSCSPWWTYQLGRCANLACNRTESRWVAQTQPPHVKERTR